jgi:hypothetical protein
MLGSTKRKPTLLTRFTAVLAMLLVLALAVLAASPDLHERLHGHDLHPATAAGHPSAADDEDGCVVTLFAQGIVLALALLALAFTGQLVRLADLPAIDRILPESPQYLFQPTQAPPR